jgi:hypothetical protein
MAKKNKTEGGNKSGNNSNNQANNSSPGTKNIGLGSNSDAGNTRGSGSGNRPSKPKTDQN